MDYQTAVETQFRPRINAALNGLRAALIAAGVQGNKITVEEVDSTDLRWRITATRGARVVVAYVELSDTLNLGSTPTGESKAVLTVWVEGDGTEITHSYTVGVPQPYTEEGGIDALLVKLTEIEATFPSIVAKVRAFLAV